MRCFSSSPGLISCVAEHLSDNISPQPAGRAGLCKRNHSKPHFALIETELMQITEGTGKSKSSCLPQVSQSNYLQPAHSALTLFVSPATPHPEVCVCMPCSVLRVPNLRSCSNTDMSLCVLFKNRKNSTLSSLYNGPIPYLTSSQKQQQCGEACGLVCRAMGSQTIHETPPFAGVRSLPWHLLSSGPSSLGCFLPVRIKLNWVGLPASKKMGLMCFFFSLSDHGT